MGDMSKSHPSPTSPDKRAAISQYFGLVGVQGERHWLLQLRTVTYGHRAEQMFSDLWNLV